MFVFAINRPFVYNEFWQSTHALRHVEPCTVSPGHLKLFSPRAGNSPPDVYRRNYYNNARQSKRVGGIHKGEFFVKIVFETCTRVKRLDGGVFLFFLDLLSRSNCVCYARKSSKSPGKCFREI